MTFDRSFDFALPVAWPHGCVSQDFRDLVGDFRNKLQMDTSENWGSQKMGGFPIGFPINQPTNVQPEHIYRYTYIYIYIYAADCGPGPKQKLVSSMAQSSLLRHSKRPPPPQPAPASNVLAPRLKPPPLSPVSFRFQKSGGGFLRFRGLDSPCSSVDHIAIFSLRLSPIPPAPFCGLDVVIARERHVGFEASN